MSIPVTAVHGIGNHLPQYTPGQAANHLAHTWSAALPQTLTAAGGFDLAVAYYAHHLTVTAQSGDDGLDDLPTNTHQWLANWADQLDALPKDVVSQAALGIPPRMLVDAIAKRRTLNKLLLRPFVAWFLTEVHRYLATPDNPARTAARNTVADTITSTGSRVVVAHSLGTVVAYEALWTIPDHPIDLFMTMGSPLGMDGVIYPHLQPPQPETGTGQRPPNVHRWINIADPGDIVAIPRPFTRRFTPDTNHENVHIDWLNPHASHDYLASAPTVAALTGYLAAHGDQRT